MLRKNQSTTEELHILKIPRDRCFPGGSEGKESACSAGDPCSIPGLGRDAGEGNGNQLQYSYLGKPTDRGAAGSSS